MWGSACWDLTDQGFNVYLPVEEAEALARAAKSSQIKNRRTRALMEQARLQGQPPCRRR